jgi:hypothetical protein
MIFEKVISPVYDDKVNSHLNDSEIWKKAYKPEEITPKIRGMYSALYEYTFQFDGLKVLQCTKLPYKI